MEIFLGMSGGPSESSRNKSKRINSMKQRTSSIKKHEHKPLNLFRKQDPRFFMPLYHLQGKYSPRYQELEDLDNHDVMNLFEISLEILNRRGVRPLLKPLEGVHNLAEYFFEKIGKANPGAHLCVQCRDYDKDENRTDDFYYMNLMEISKKRTILCSDCMKTVVSTHVTGEVDELLEELENLRKEQPGGVNVDPFLVSCGF
eukprot:TCONS_00057486-protein